MLVNDAGFKTTLNAIKEYIRKQTIYLKSYVHEQISSSYQTFKSLIKQPDWNQNNINASDYVKNRTHYSIGRWADLTFDNMRNKPDIRFVLIEGRKYEVTNTLIDIAYAYYDVEDLYQIVVGFRDHYVRLKKIENNMRTDDNSECKVWLEDVHPIHRVFLPNGNIVNGSAEGSIRGYHASEESSSYTMGRHSHAEGSSTESSGDYSHAEGLSTKSSGKFSHAEGLGTKSSGESSHAEGLRAESSGDYSHAEGVDSKSVGRHSHAEGDRTKSSGESSHAEGRGTESSGDYSHAEGLSTKSSGKFSHAEGLGTKSSGESSHAEGSYTKAQGDFAHAEGLRTIANANYSHAQGKCNKEDSSGTYAHIVGNGTSDTKRSNAHTLDWSGNAWFAGDVYVRSTSGTDKDEGSKKLATEEYVDNAKVEAQQLGLMSVTPGQFIIVKSVDENGAPTEWEALPGTISKDLINAGNIGQALGVSQVTESDCELGFIRIPKLSDFLGLNIQNAKVGELVQVEYVDDFGNPTGYKTVPLPTTDKWEKIKEIVIAEDAEESNALTINTDEDGNAFRLKKARLCAKFPAYTGESEIPNFSFAMINGKTEGLQAPLLYTSVWPKISASTITGMVYEVDVSGPQQIETVQLCGNLAWRDDSGRDYVAYGTTSDTQKRLIGSPGWAYPIISIGGTSMLIYPGCRFELYGVRAEEDETDSE